MDRQTQKTIDALIASKAVNTAIDLRGRTCLSIASSCGHIPTVKSILKAKARVDQRLKSGSTALIVAAQNGFLHLQRILKAFRLTVTNQARIYLGGSHWCPSQRQYCIKNWDDSFNRCMLCWKLQSDEITVLNVIRVVVLVGSLIC